MKELRKVVYFCLDNILRCIFEYSIHVHAIFVFIVLRTVLDISLKRLPVYSRCLSYSSSPFEVIERA